MNKLDFCFLLCLLLVGCVDSRSLSERVRDVFRIKLIPEIDKPGAVLARSDEVLLCRFPDNLIQELSAQQLPGYTNWKKLPENESHGDNLYVVDGSNGNWIYAQANINHHIKRVFVNVDQKLIAFMYFST